MWPDVGEREGPSSPPNQMAHRYKIINVHDLISVDLPPSKAHFEHTWL